MVPLTTKLMLKVVIRSSLISKGAPVTNAMQAFSQGQITSSEVDIKSWHRTTMPQPAYQDCIWSVADQALSQPYMPACLLCCCYQLIDSLLLQIEVDNKAAGLTVR